MSSTNRGGKRAPSDFYRTEPYCVRRLLEAVKLPGGVWLEPSAGDGAIIKAVNSLRSDVRWFACDIRKQTRNPLVALVGEEQVEIRDFLTAPAPATKIDVLLTNPPFSLAEEFLVHGLKFAHWVVLLLRLDFLGSVRRSELLRSNMPNVYELPNRPSFGKNKNGKRGHDSNEYAWFIWPPWRNRTQGIVKILALTSQEERKADREALKNNKKGGVAHFGRPIELPPAPTPEFDDEPDASAWGERPLVREVKDVDGEFIKYEAVEPQAVEVGNKKIASDENANANEIATEDANVNAIEAETVTATENANANAHEQEIDIMAYLPTGFGADVANAEATIARQKLSLGDYVFLHRQIFTKNTKKGDAVIIEHKIVEAKPIKPGIEPSPVGTNWGYFLPKYGEAAVMLLPNLKAYLLGILGLNEKNISKEQLAAAFDRMGGPEQACCGMYVRGVTFETETKAGDDFVGVNWSPYPGENVFGSANVLARRNEIMAELGNTAGGNGAANGVQAGVPQGMVQTPAGLAVPAGAMPGAPAVGAPQMPMTQMGAVAPQVPAAPQVPTGPAQKLALAIQQGWQKHPNTPGWFWHPGLPSDIDPVTQRPKNLKSEAELSA